MDLYYFNNSTPSSSKVAAAGNLMSAGFILQEQKTGMCCCLSGLHGLFSGLVSRCMLQPSDPSFCWVQFICVCIVDVLLLGSVASTLCLLVHCMIVVYGVYVYVPELFVWKLIAQKASTFQTICFVSLSLTPLTCSFLWKYKHELPQCGRLLLAVVFLGTSLYGVTTAWWG